MTSSEARAIKPVSNGTVQLESRGFELVSIEMALPVDRCLAEDGSLAAPVRPHGTGQQPRLVRSGFWHNALRRASSMTRSSWRVNASPDQLAPPGRGRRKQPQLWLHARGDAAPRGSAKEAKAAEDCVAIGGMRHPRLSVGKVPGLRSAGAMVRVALETFLDGRPDVIDLIEASTSGGTCLVAESTLDELATLLGKTLGTDKLGKGPRSLWRAGLVQAFVRSAGDPDTALGRWLEHGAPTGVARDIECLGIFPQTSPKGWGHSDLWEHWALAEPTANYSSIEDNETLVRAEFQRLAAL